MNKLFAERVFQKLTTLTATIHKNMRKKCTTQEICTPSGTTVKVAHMERLGMIALINLIDGPGMMQLASVFENRVTDECLSLYKVDGSMRRTAKNKILDMLKLKTVADEPRDHIAIIDMGMIWRLATPTSKDREIKKRDGTHYLWSDYLNKICMIVFSRHHDTCLMILVNDRYDLPFSIKDDEHD